MLSKKILLGYTIFFLFVGLFLSINNIWIPYSFWYDEIWSMAMAEMNLEFMIKNISLVDVHPPLYNILLNIWVHIFGSTEFASRLLSLIFSLGALIIFGKFLYKNFKNNISVTAILFFSTSYLFVYYSQEVRSYSMMLCFSALLVVISLDIIKNNNLKTSRLISLFITTIILSLIHFFGLIFSGLILIYFLFYFNNIKQKIIVLLAGIISLSWPLYHILFGGLSKSLGGSFWIESNGIQTTLQIFFNSLFPQSYIINKLVSKSYQEYFTSIIGIFIFIILSYIAFKNVTNTEKEFKNNDEKSFKFIFSIILSFVFVVSLIDLYTPISTPRNYIVLLPIFSLSISYILLIFFNKKIIYFSILTILLTTSSLFSYLRIVEKQFPLQNHKDIAQFLINNNLLEGKEIFYIHSLKEKTSFENPISNEIASFYIKEHNHNVIKNITLNELYNLNKSSNFIFLSQHVQIDSQKLFDELKKLGFNVDLYIPKQRWENSSFVIYSK